MLSVPVSCQGHAAELFITPWTTQQLSGRKSPAERRLVLPTPGEFVPVVRALDLLSAVTTGSARVGEGYDVVGFAIGWASHAVTCAQGKLSTSCVPAAAAGQ